MARNPDYYTSPIPNVFYMAGAFPDLARSQIPALMAHFFYACKAANFKNIDAAFDATYTVPSRRIARHRQTARLLSDAFSKAGYIKIVSRAPRSKTVFHLTPKLKKALQQSFDDLDKSSISKENL